MFTNEVHFNNNIALLEKKFTVKKIISAVKESNDRISDAVCNLLSEKYEVSIKSKYHV